MRKSLSFNRDISGYILGLLCLFIFTSRSLAQSVHRVNVVVDYHYGNSFITEPQEDDINGRYGYGISVHYLLGDRESRFQTALGIAYSRIGNSRQFLWEDATPEREMLYGKFPIHYAMWDDVHYLSIPFTLRYYLAKSWMLDTEFFLDYPIGTSYYRNRSSDDGGLVEINQDPFNTTKAYPLNTSIGMAVQLGKTFVLSEKMHLFIGSKFRVYALMAARSNDYYPHEEYERPYSLGLNIGISF